MAHGANDAVFVGDGGKCRHQFTDLQSGGCGRDGFIGSAEVSGCMGFGVPRVQLTESAVLKHEDAGFGCTC